jgi:general secretion pathway protein K
MRAVSSVEPSGHGSDEGFVLVLVLWALALMSVIAMTAMTATRSEIRTRAAITRNAEFALLADGFVKLSAWQLTNRRAATTLLQVDGTPRVCHHNDTAIEVRVTDAGGLVDLNAASGDLLERVLRSAGASATVATALSAQIQDYRDSDEIETVDGAETPTYLRAGRRYGAKNGLFDSVEELDQILAMTPDLLASLRPLVTVDSRIPSVDPSVAPEGVLRALAGQVLPVGLEQAGPTSLRDPNLYPQHLLAHTSSRAFHIEVTARRATAGGFTRRAVIELSPKAQHGFFVREWGVGASKSTFDVPNLGVCFSP